MTTARTNPRNTTPLLRVIPIRSRGLIPELPSFLKRITHTRLGWFKLPTAIRSVVRSTIVMNAPDQVSSNIQEDDGIKAGIVTQPRTREGGP